MTIADRWAALQFDSAVTTFGTIIENYAQEQINVGGESNPRWVAKYSLQQLLTPGFVLDSDNGDGDELPVRVDGLLYDEVG